MRESRTYGFVRGARGNSRPYRVRCCLLQCVRPVMAQSVSAAMSAITPLLEDKRKQAEVAYARLLYKMYAVTDMMEVNSKSVSGDE
jgi:hypothetical protein